ncbi:MAG: DUF418 domain-containing protein [Pseudomonadota bacterium]
MSAAAPVQAAERIEALDVLRGFALLGILLMNIVGMGMASGAYFSPLLTTPPPGVADLVTWHVMEGFVEGAMRGLFSMLFGAGVVLFTTGARGKSARLHYRRTFWLLVFGLIDGFVLLWSGDILVNYAVAGALLYLVRDAKARSLLIGAGALFLVIALQHGAASWGLGMSRAAGAEVAAIEAAGGEATAEQLELAAAWPDFVADFGSTPEQIAAELAQRRGDVGSVYGWYAEEFIGTLLFVLPFVMLWDALAMMLVGMALFKLGVLNASRSDGFYWRMLLVGFGVGGAVNAYEGWHAFQNDYALQASFPFLQFTYDIGRFGMALGYLALVMLICRARAWPGLRARLAAVGRLALTNYLVHSLLAMFIFTGVGLALVGELARWQLYPIVLAIWALQLWLSPAWLARYSMGPIEALWRRLTYGAPAK